MLWMWQQDRRRRFQQRFLDTTSWPPILTADSTIVQKLGDSTYSRRLCAPTFHSPLTSVFNPPRTQDHLMVLQSKIWSNIWHQPKTTDLFWIPKRPNAWKFMFILILGETGISQQLPKMSALQSHLQDTLVCLLDAQLYEILSYKHM